MSQTLSSKIPVWTLILGKMISLVYLEGGLEVNIICVVTDEDAMLLRSLWRRILIWRFKS
jgi:hypothetical protein